MKITNKQFEKLKKLSNLQFVWDKNEKMKKDLWPIITLLHKLDELDLGDVGLDDESLWWMHLNEWIHRFDNNEWLLANVKHEVSWNTIAIKSFRSS